ncbi:MAG: PQQ-binding-like beta-propeller repeat protein [Verrucomicrobiota bacterium]
MKCSRLSVFLLLAMLTPAYSSDWPVWRGPNLNGIASSAARPPSMWSEDENVKWSAHVPGWGLSSPIVSGNLVVVTTAVEDAQFVLAYDRLDGSVRWKTLAHEGGVPTKLHKKNSPASSTVASDGEFFYALFHNSERLFLSKIDRIGEIVWQKDTGGFICDYNFGYGASPALHNGNLIVVSEYGEGYVAAFETSDGSEVWRTPRENKTSYSSPIVANVAGREQLVLSGADTVTSYDPSNGKILWQTPGTSLATCGTIVWSEDTVFASGGYPNKETIAVKADGSGSILWKNSDKTYEQSMLYHDGHLYTLNDNGIAICWVAATGEEKWKERLGGPVSASPILAGGHIYATNERGITHVFKPNPNEFEKVGEFRIGDEGFATPSFAGSEVFIRSAEVSGGERKEFLVCLEE